MLIGFNDSICGWPAVFFQKVKLSIKASLWGTKEQNRQNESAKKIFLLIINKARVNYVLTFIKATSFIESTRRTLMDQKEKSREQ